MIAMETHNIHSSKKSKATRREHPSTPTEHAVLKILRDILDVPDDGLGVNDSLFDFGVTSIDHFILKRRIEGHLHIGNVLNIGNLLTTRTIRAIATELESFGQDSGRDYDPVVPLQSNRNSTKTPLWLVHPGSGDLLVFVALARHFF